MFILMIACILDYRQFKDVKQSTLANYQAKNIALAIETILYLRNNGFLKISDSAIYQGIAASKWKGRFEVVSNNPLVIIDGAHNDEGMRALVESCQKYDKIQILFSALKDKPTGKMIEDLLTLSDNIIVTEFDFYRASSAEDLANGYPVTIIKDYKEAIETLLSKEADLHLICGSLYFISIVREYFMKKGESTKK